MEASMKVGGVITKLMDMYKYSKKTISLQGEYKWSDGRKYKGEWLDNNMHGKGEYIWTDGRMYVGDY